MIQTTIFDMLYPKYKITKPIRLIEMFAGYGSQALALKYLDVSFEHWKICEWAVKSIQAYKDIHFTDKHLTFNKKRTKQEIVDYLFKLGISANYNEPMTKEQINRLSEEQLKTILENIAITHNLVNIQQVKGKDLEIVDTDNYEYILTYSFPCQDLSLAGKGKGMSDTSTRSGMLWEVERILTECKELGTLPQCLIMENVVQVHGEGNVEDFNKWQLRLEELGYKNYWEDLIATDYEIPQTRNRCFMVSILGDYSYSFPSKQPLKLKLKDMLEDNVDEKYYLSNKMIEYIYSDDNSGKYNRKAARESCDISASNNDYLLIKNATAKGYLEAKEGDGVDISSRMQHHRGTVQKNMIQTLDTQCTKGVIVKNSQEITLELIKDVTSGKYNNGNVYGKHLFQSSRFNDKPQKNISATIKAGNMDAGVINGLRIRKLTPKECFRLMGVKDEDYEKVAKNQSNASLYHLAGDSIVVNVLMAIFKEMIKNG